MHSAVFEGPRSPANDPTLTKSRCQRLSGRLSVDPGDCSSLAFGGGVGSRIPSHTPGGARARFPRARLRGGPPTFSHSVRTWFSFSCLHSFSCSTHWSSSLVNALSSMAASRASPPPPPPPAPGGTTEPRSAQPAPRPSPAGSRGPRPPGAPAPPGPAPGARRRAQGSERGAVRGRLRPDSARPPAAAATRRPLRALAAVLSLFLFPPSGFPSSPGHFRREKASGRCRRARRTRRGAAPSRGSAEKRSEGPGASILPLVLPAHPALWEAVPRLGPLSAQGIGRL